MIVEIVLFVTNSLLGVFSMDLTYFEAALPIAGDILNVVIAAGWALLLGNLVFQAAKSMISGLGFEGEDPKTLFMRTFVFAFLLLASRQICDIGLGISKEIITLLQMPSNVNIYFPTGFTLGSAWLLQIIIGLVLMWQVVKLFFEVGERYFLVGFLTLMAPLAFSMGGSKNTSDVFKGWVRMFASMCLMMVLNVVFLKLLMSAMQTSPKGFSVFPWLIFVVAIARTARKIDMVITRIGLNPAMTGGTGRGLPGMLTYTIMRSITSNIAKAASGASKSRTPPAGRQNPSGASPAGNMGIPAGRGAQGGATGRGSTQSTSSTSNTNTSNTSATQNTQSTSQQVLHKTMYEETDAEIWLRENMESFPIRRGSDDRRDEYFSKMVRVVILHSHGNPVIPIVSRQSVNFLYCHVLRYGYSLNYVVAAVIAPYFPKNGQCDGGPVVRRRAAGFYPLQKHRLI